MQELVWEYRYVLIVIVSTGLFAIFEWSQFKVKAYAIMLQAKRLAKDAVLNSGLEEEAWVVEKIYLMLPAPVVLLVDEELIRKAVKYLYDKAKDYLNNGELDNNM